MPLSNPLSSSASNLAAFASFQTRVLSRLYVACQNVYSNNGSNIAPDAVLFYTRRKAFAIQVEASIPLSTYPASAFFVGVSTDATVLSDATQASTVDVVTGNVAAQQLLVTDTHIDNAISAQLNSYLQPA